jgi:hypothetical protein
MPGNGLDIANSPPVDVPCRVWRRRENPAREFSLRLYSLRTANFKGLRPESRARPHALPKRAFSFFRQGKKILTAARDDYTDD